ncbi:hypothetical protein K466DRAFT_603413 [Polyporus arcularius HHB13444]|uniref:Uncharacterized protein n=1 Tax=Polyporus arcularius HHB13444 TaxID=1314778 RepID=A0A5C3PAB1_9APHY|nr:hypothetical protein K466DRAFT_603413 [Polyporus arcularius HHB13444]
MSDWLDTARVLRRRLDDLELSGSRQTMITACLQHSTTFARLACFLAGAPHDDVADYKELEDEFIEAMQGFQGTYQKVRQRVRQERNLRENGKVGVEVGVEEPTTPSLHAMPPPSSPSLRSSIYDSGECLESTDETLGDLDDTESMGSQRSDKQWDAEEEFYTRAHVSLVADLQDPLFAQLHQPLADSLVTPLLEELTSPLEECLAGRLPARLATSPALLHSLMGSLTQHKPFLAALADRLRMLEEPEASSSSVSMGAHTRSHASGPVNTTLPFAPTLPESAHASFKRESPKMRRTMMKKPRLETTD